MEPCQGEPTFNHQKKVVLGLDHFQLMETNDLKPPTDSNIIDSILSDIVANNTRCVGSYYSTSATCLRSNFFHKDYNWLVEYQISFSK